MDELEEVPDGGRRRPEDMSFASHLLGQLRLVTLTAEGVLPNGDAAAGGDGAACSGFLDYKRGDAGAAGEHGGHLRHRGVRVGDVSDPQPGSRPQADIGVCFDTTGSMDRIIGGLVRQTSTFVVEAQSRSIDLHWGLVAFGDLRVPGDRIVRYPFTDRPGQFVRALEEMPRFSGGGNTGETSLDALATLAGHSGWRPAVVRICLLFTDEPPVGVHTDLEAVGKMLRQQKIATFCITNNHRAYRWLANVTGGEWWDIYEPGDFDRLLARLASSVVRLVDKTWPRIGAPGH